MHNVFWETPYCAKGAVRLILKPIDSAVQEPLLDFLSMNIFPLFELICFVSREHVHSEGHKAIQHPEYFLGSTDSPLQSTLRLHL